MMSARIQGQAFAVASGAGAAPRSGLPTELLQQASTRLGLVSLIYAVTYSAAFYPAEIIRLSGGNVPVTPGPVEHVAAAVSIAASVAIFLLTRFASWNPSALLDLGLLYEVVASFGIAVAEFWRVSFDAHMFMMEAGGKPWSGISWVCVWILTFPIIVPSTPGKTLLAALASASMPPLAMLLSLALDATPSVPGIAWLGLLTATYGSATIAYITSRHIYGLGREIREAREMGSYRLLERLGTGGMGEVWKAEHRLLARPAAIKLIRPESLRAGVRGGSVQQRFEREARATATLRSPHTVELYDFGVTDDGRFYYAMELLEGLDLDTFVDRFGAIPAARAASWMLQACESLAEAHARGLVHRDIKPANIYTCRLGMKVDFIKVLDFGLVKRSLDADVATRLTVDGTPVGTPGYMAPEMAEGSGGADHRVDIYALGCVLYRLLTGSLVFESESPVKVIVDHVQTPPVPPSRRTELPIPPRLDEIVLACLAKRPGERPQTAEDLAAELRALGLASQWTQADAEAWWALHMPVARAEAGPLAAPSGHAADGGVSPADRTP